MGFALDSIESARDSKELELLANGEDDNTDKQSYYNTLSVKEKLVWETDHQDSFNQKILKVQCLN